MHNACRSYMERMVTRWSPHACTCVECVNFHASTPGLRPHQVYHVGGADPQQSTVYDVNTSPGLREFSSLVPAPSETLPYPKI